MNKVILKYIGLIVFALIIGASHAFAQEGFGTPSPDKSAVIDMTSEKRGLLIPRVALVSTTNNTNPIANPANSLLVYNTVSATGLKPGYYYFKRDQPNSTTVFTGVWVAMAADYEVDLRMLANNNHLTMDAGVGGDGTSLGTGENNIAIGKSLMSNITTGRRNIAMGSETMQNITTGNTNVAIGYKAMSGLETGVRNIAIGSEALRGVERSSDNIAIGHSALRVYKESSPVNKSNIGIGAFALNSLRSGEGNLAIGDRVALSLTDSEHNTIIGNFAFQFAKGSKNTILGAKGASGYENRDNIINNSIYIGYLAGDYISGTDNIVVGNESFKGNTGLRVEANNNLLIGSGMANPTGIITYGLERNVFLGSSLLKPNYTNLGVTDITHSILLGDKADFDITTPTIEYATAIGAGAKVGANNSIVLGRTSTAPITSINYGAIDKVGIGVTAPQNALHVVVKENPVRFEGLQTGTATDKTVVVDANGVLKQVDQSTLEVTADNGLTKTASNIQLGGPLTDPTAIITDATNTLAIEGLQAGIATDQIVVADATTGVLKQMKAAMPKFFYMPSIVMPTHTGHFVPGDGFSESGGVFSVSLYARYTAQFGSPEVTNPTQTTTLPVLPANELDYSITYYDKAVFQNVNVTDVGVLTYEVIIPTPVTQNTFMNIVFAVKP